MGQWWVSGGAMVVAESFNKPGGKPSFLVDLDRLI